MIKTIYPFNIEVNNITYVECIKNSTCIHMNDGSTRTVHISYKRVIEIITDKLKPKYDVKIFED